MFDPLPTFFRRLDATGRFATWAFTYNSPVLKDPIAIDVYPLPEEDVFLTAVPGWLYDALPAIGRCIDSLGRDLPSGDNAAYVMRSSIAIGADHIASFIIESCDHEGMFWETVVDEKKFPKEFDVSCWGGNYQPTRDYLDRLAPGHSLMSSDIPERFWST
jgi:hypothetical protein